jgi:hypothetical protein
VIYRRSATSVTFRCNHCTLQWAITFLKMHQAAKAMAAKSGGPEKFFFETVASMSEDALDHEGARRTAIKRQTNRRVIRLPDRKEN